MVPSPLRAAIGDGHGQGLPAPAQRAEIGTAQPTSRSGLSTTPVTRRVIIVARTNGAIKDDHAEQHMVDAAGSDLFLNLLLPLLLLLLCNHIHGHMEDEH